VNDVVLAVTAGAIRLWMHARGLRTEGVELRAGVPVSTRSSEERGALGNRLTQLVAPLPVDVADPVARLRLVQEAMTGLKESRMALGAEVIAGAQEFAPPTILAQSTRMNFSTRAYNVLVTNIPGPQVPLHLLGRELAEIYPLAFLAGDRALAVAVMSYNGTVGFGLIADLDKLADLDVLAEGFEETLAEYLTLTARRERRLAKERARR
jgi:WS/DGAT/MGAT family acyltransferase